MASPLTATQGRKLLRNDAKELGFGELTGKAIQNSNVVKNMKRVVETVLAEKRKKQKSSRRNPAAYREFLESRMTYTYTVQRRFMKCTCPARCKARQKFMEKCYSEYEDLLETEIDRAAQEDGKEQKRTVAGLKGKIGQITAAKQRLESALCEAQGTIDEMRGRIGSMEEKIEELEARVKIDQTARQTGMEVWDELQREVERYKSESYTNAARINQLEGELEELRESLQSKDTAIYEWTDRVMELESQIAELAGEPRDQQELAPAADGPQLPRLPERRREYSELSESQQQRIKRLFQECIRITVCCYVYLAINNSDGNMFALLPKRRK